MAGAHLDWTISAEERAALAGLMIQDHRIRQGTALQPSAYMLPGGLMPGVTIFRGVPVVRGDRTAVLYDAEPQL